jgi:hypothetical protein
MSEDTRGSLVKGSIWRQLSSDSRRKWKSLSVQYVANMKAPMNKIRSKARGVSLEMLQSAGVMGADLSDPQCNRFISELAETQSDVALFVQRLVPLHAEAQHWHAVFKQASENGLLAPLGDTALMLQFFDTLVKGLDVYSHCPQLAPAHAVVDKEAGPSQGAFFLSQYVILLACIIYFDLLEVWSPVEA